MAAGLAQRTAMITVAGASAVVGEVGEGLGRVRRSDACTVQSSIVARRIEPEVLG